MRPIAPADKDKYVAWDVLRHELATHHEQVLDDWLKMLADDALNEHQYRTFLRDNAGFFFHDFGHTLVSITELELGADGRIDFAIANDQHSYGFNFELIEIESPSDPVYVRAGTSAKPSSCLTEAVAQVLDWKRWIAGHLSEAKQLFPSKFFSVSDTPPIDYTVIIGRREDTLDFQHLRNYYAKELGVTIRSFDYLTSRAQERMFAGVPVYSSVEMHGLPLLTANQLVNPFAKSYTSKAWRGIVRDPKLDTRHMVPLNADLLLKSRELNSERHDKFIGDWSKLPDVVKESYWKRLELFR
ncbi:MAG: hypothetical protein JWN24_2256 [Phycisphaerales bacterium]|nr:hypothetical protein [Phycisphaerales bacterium]